MVPVGQISQVANSDAPRADFDIADRPLAVLHTIQPIALMAGGFVEMDILFTNRFCDDRFRCTAEVAAIDNDFAGFADERYTSAFTMNDFHAILVNEPHALLGIDVFWRNDLDWPRFIHAEAPLGNVEMMCAPVGHHAARVFAVVAPIWKMIVHTARAKDGIVWPLGSRPEPGIPIETRFPWFLRQVTPFAGTTDVDNNRFDFSNSSASH